MTIDQAFRNKYKVASMLYARRKRAGLVVPKHTTEPKVNISFYTTEKFGKELDAFIAKKGYPNRSVAINDILKTYIGVDNG